MGHRLSAFVCHQAKRHRESIFGQYCDLEQTDATAGVTIDDALKLARQPTTKRLAYASQAQEPESQRDPKEAMRAFDRWPNGIGDEPPPFRFAPARSWGKELCKMLADQDALVHRNLRF
jgi:hypothetical protein